MTRPELRRLDKIIASVERLKSDMDDMVSQQQLGDAARDLLALYNTAKRACDATERV